MPHLLSVLPLGQKLKIMDSIFFVTIWRKSAPEENISVFHKSIKSAPDENNHGYHLWHSIFYHRLLIKKPLRGDTLQWQRRRYALILIVTRRPFLYIYSITSIVDEEHNWISLFEWYLNMQIKILILLHCKTLSLQLDLYVKGETS